MTNPLPPTDPISPEHRQPPTITANAREAVRDPLHFYQSIAAEYGDIVCYRPAPEPAYLINHPDYIRHVLVDNNRNYSKDTYSNRLFSKVVGHGLLTSEGDEWRKQRRMMQPAFHHTRIEKLDGMIVEATQSMLGGWQQAFEANQPIDIAREMAALTLTVTTRSLFGVDLGDEARKVGEIINHAASDLEKPGSARLIQSSKEFGEVVDRIIQQRKQNFKDGGDLLSSMLMARDDDGTAALDDAIHHFAKFFGGLYQPGAARFLQVAGGVVDDLAHFAGFVAEVETEQRTGGDSQGQGGHLARNVNRLIRFEGLLPAIQHGLRCFHDHAVQLLDACVVEGRLHHAPLFPPFIALRGQQAVPHHL